MTAAGQRRTAARRTAGGENGTPDRGEGASVALGRGEGLTGVLADSGSLCHHLAMETSTWPQLTVDSWTATRDTLHMWLQIVGKIQLESTPLINHWWNVTFEVSARGLRTRTMWQADAAFDAEFDFVNHELVFRTVRGDSRSIALEPRTVADFYSATFGALQSLGIHVDISATPNEVAPAIAFADDTTHHHYDPVAVHTFWRQLVASAQVFQEWSAGFAGKNSPVALFWGSLDLSCVRFSGRAAPPYTGTPPPACGPQVMAEAESRENAAAGFWAGGSDEGSFYAYAYPSPDGYSAGKLSAGHFDEALGEYILPYAQVRQSSDPRSMVLTFLDETYALAADLGKWDRSLLDIDPDRLADAQ